MKFIFLRFCSNSKGKTSILQIRATLSACKLESDAHEPQIKIITSSIMLLKKAVFADRFPMMTWDVTMCSCPHPADLFLSQGRQHFTCRNTIVLTLKWYILIMARVPALSPSRG